MGLPQARLTDIGYGVCTCHNSPITTTGQVITGSPNTYCNKLSICRLSDVVLGHCGHTGTMVAGSFSVFTNDLQQCRLSDPFVGCFTGILVSGSPNTFTGSTKLAPFRDGERYTEVDYGNLDDEEDVDDGLNIYPPTNNPTPAEITRSASLEVAPKNTVDQDTDSPPTSAGDTPPTTCVDIPSLPVPDSTPLTANYTVGSLTTQPVISTYKIRAQAGFTLDEILCNLQAWAEYIGEPLLAKYGSSMFITSGFRYGSGRSQHDRGQAGDIQFKGFTNQQYYDVAIWVKNNLQYDQLILEYGGNRPWLHISFNRNGNRSAAAGNKFGTRISAGNYVWRQLIYRS